MTSPARVTAAASPGAPVADRCAHCDQEIQFDQLTNAWHDVGDDFTVVFCSPHSSLRHKPFLDDEGDPVPQWVIDRHLSPEAEAAREAGRG